MTLDDDLILPTQANEQQFPIGEDLLEHSVRSIQQIVEMMNQHVVATTKSNIHQRIAEHTVDTNQ